LYWGRFVDTYVCQGEELSDLAPVRCGKGIRASMAYIVDDLKTLKDLTK